MKDKIQDGTIENCLSEELYQSVSRYIAEYFTGEPDDDFLFNKSLAFSVEDPDLSWKERLLLRV